MDSRTQLTLPCLPTARTVAAQIKPGARGEGTVTSWDPVWDHGPLAPPFAGGFSTAVPFRRLMARSTMIFASASETDG